MIALLHLDPARHCLRRMGAAAGQYVCHRERGHQNGHDYLPIDMIVIDHLTANHAPPATEQPVQSINDAAG
jgi:hypothetical protein